MLQIDFDFLNHRLLLSTNLGNNDQIDLYQRSVADFYRELFEKLNQLNINTVIYAVPNEVEPAIPLQKDEVHKTYYKEKMTWNFLLYEVIRKSDNPEETLLRFMQTTYKAAANTAN